MNESHSIHRRSEIRDCGLQTSEKQYILPNFVASARRRIVFAQSNNAAGNS